MRPEGPGETVEIKMLDVANGRTLVRSHGSGGVPLVLLHGVLSDGGSWDPVAGPLSRDRLVLAPDMPLHGGTETSREFAPDPEGMVGWLEGLMEALDIEEADICGLSMGGAVAAHFARLRPHRICRLVLVDAANITPMGEAYMGFIREVRDRMETSLGIDLGTASECWSPEVGLEGAKEAAIDMCTDPIVLSVLEYLEVRGLPIEQIVRGLDLLEPLTIDRLGQIRAPTMVIWGAEDPFFQADDAVLRLQEGLPGAQIEVLEATGHNPVVEAPVRFVELVERFLD